MGSYTKKLTLSDSEKIIIEATFSKKRIIYKTVWFLLPAYFLFGIISSIIEDPDKSGLLYDPDTPFTFGIFFMYSFVWVCINLRNLLSQEVTLTNKRLIIRTGASTRNIYDMPINIIHSIQINDNKLSVYVLDGGNVSIKNIKNILPLSNAIQEQLDTKNTLSNSELQKEMLMKLTKLSFHKQDVFWSTIKRLAFWLILVPFMGFLFTGITEELFGN